jgi:hypothetical protein
VNDPFNVPPAVASDTSADFSLARGILEEFGLILVMRTF